MSNSPIIDVPQQNSGAVKTGNQDIFFAVGIAGMLAVLFLPLPTMLIDFGLVISFALAILILMVALWTKKPLEFSAFPLVLLIATMLRLSLNIATTRGILAHGHEGEQAAGKVVAGFARFVMDGDFVIGLIVFAILVTINFIVITKGATRIAEVSARFTLDGIPGKQMAIDADLSSGLITNEVAQKRRRELEEESAFFGAMDGASKFVRGDAVAGLIITFVNIFGGIIIGVMRYDMAFGEAADVFTKLSVGDGLVTQIPALIISLAAGLLVSKGQTSGAAHESFFKQLGGSSRALTVSAGMLVVLALMPGLPALPFMAAATGFFIAARLIPKRAAAAQKLVSDGEKALNGIEQQKAKDSIKTSLEVSKIELALGRQLSARLLSDHSELASRVGKMRKRFARQYGFIVPEITLSDDLDLPPKDYELRVHGSAVARATLPLGELTIVLGEREPPAMPHESYREPAFGLKAVIIPVAYNAQARQAGYEPVEDISVLLTHVSETLARNLAQLLSYGDVRALLDRLTPEYHRLLDEITPQHLSLSGLQAILKMLLAEQISVRNLALILEAVAEVAPHMKRPELIVEHVRMRISQQICADIAENGALKVLRLGTKWERAFQQAIKRDPRGETIGFDFEPKEIENFGKETAQKIDALQNEGHRFALITAPDARVYVRMIIERVFPTLPILSHVEIARGAKIEVLGSVE